MNHKTIKYIQMSCKPRHSKNNSAILGSFLVDVSRETSSLWEPPETIKTAKPLSHKFQRCGSIFYRKIFPMMQHQDVCFLTARISSGCQKWLVSITGYSLGLLRYSSLDIQYSNIHIPESFISLDDPWETWWHLGKDSGQADRKRIRPPQNPGS